VMPRNSAAKPGPSGVISIGEPSVASVAQLSTRSRQAASKRAPTQQQQGGESQRYGSSSLLKKLARAKGW
jgi:hypothetical protein